METQPSDLVEPTRANRVRWLVEFVRQKSPAHSSTIPREEIERVVGLRWDDAEMRRSVLTDAKKALLRGLPPYEFSATAEGLYFFNDAERVGELRRREREAAARYREAIASASTIDRTKLTVEEAQELDRSQAACLKAYNEAKRQLRRIALTAGGSLKLGDGA